MFNFQNFFSKPVDSILADFEKIIRQLEQRQEVMSICIEQDAEIIKKATARVQVQTEESKRAGVVIERIKKLIN